ncbi:MAG: AAA family ATPase [Candidatus Aminicenantales bacterium]
MATIAVSGKGGTGKTTISAFIIRWLCEKSSKSILAVDADANVSLNEVLGIEIQQTVGAIREEMRIKADTLPAGMTKQRFLEYKIQTSLVETQNFDLIAMGRPEGPGCYCYANNLLRDILSSISKNYEYVVIDNEAGMEHLSRRTVQEIDLLLIVSEPTVRGIQTAGKISRLIKELESRVKEKMLILNRVGDSLSESIKEAIKEEKLNLTQLIPEDETLLYLDRQGKPVWDYLPNSPAYEAIDSLMKKIMKIFHKK